MDSISPEKPKRTGAAFNPMLLVAGLLLMLPLCGIVWQTRLAPVLYTFNISFTKYDVIREPQYIGAENYTRIMQDARFQKSIGFTLKIVLQRFGLFLIIPPLVGLLA